MRAYDLAFLKRFSMVIAFLVLVALVLALFAHHLNSKVQYPADPVAKQKTLERIAPVGAVYAGATGAAEQAAAAAAAVAAAAANVPFGGRTDGAEIFNNGPCTGCHTNGVGGAPKLDAAGIGARVAQQGIDELVKKAISGFTGTAGVMPPKGGNPALTDEQIRAAVEYMVAQSKK
ncbi:c-type cytochrome [Thermomonas hydrothermalis]|uniref:c-type cytochrome n=1 Tax=Thermomonas hydrothermalis TaxID=213588 RepID=UPI0009322BF4|nr:c-type cytochrome [Thermomonas hydrothermalis]MCL6619583.1 c-type cytochrome [Thermomonas hydrothermalis]